MLSLTIEGGGLAMQRFGQLALAGALGVTLCSCAQQKQMTQAQLTATNDEAGAQCQNLGATPGTPAYKECVDNITAAIRRGYPPNAFVDQGDGKTINKNAGF
jgi:hypothetical protein